MAGNVSDYAIESAYKNLENDALTHTQAQEHPKAIIVLGQPGAVDSTLATDALREFKGQGGSVIIDTDRLINKDPHHSTDEVKYPVDSPRLESSEWVTRLTITAEENRRNLVIINTLENPKNISDLAAHLKKQGYEVEARISAVNPELSVNRSRLRFEEQNTKLGIDHLVHQNNHDTASKELAPFVSSLEIKKQIDSLHIYDNKRNLIYENRLDLNEWQHTPNGAKVIAHEHSLALTHAERVNRVSTLENIVALKKQYENPSITHDNHDIPYHHDLDDAKNRMSDAGRLARDKLDEQIPKKTDIDSVIKKLDLARDDLEQFEKSTVYQRAAAFDQLNKKDALVRYPELDGAYKQLSNLKQEWTAHDSLSDKESLYNSTRSALSDQLHRGTVPSGNVSPDESRRAIEMAANYRGLMVRDADELKQDFKGEVLAHSSHHVLLKVSGMVAVRYEKTHLDRELEIGERVSIQHHTDKNRVLEHDHMSAIGPEREMSHDIKR